MNKNIWILIMGFFLFQACLDDEGNYSYSDLLPIEIDSSKMSNSDNPIGLFGSRSGS